MTARVFVDTNVLVNARDASERRKQQAGGELDGLMVIDPFATSPEQLPA